MSVKMHSSDDLIGSHLPNCPVNDAKAEKGTFYRLMKNGKFSSNNFLSRVKLGMNVDKTLCEEHALSLTLTLEQARYMRMRFPKAFGRSRIAEVKIDNGHGLVHKNREDHANWWHPESLDPITIARLVEE